VKGACSLDAPLMSFPDASTTTARVPPVPTSIPRNHIISFLPIKKIAIPQRWQNIISGRCVDSDSGHKE
jgi:hypothetical protein